MTFEDCVGDHSAHEFTSADRVVVTRNHVVDQIGITIRVNDGHEWESKLVGFCDSGVLELRIENKHGVWRLGQTADATEVSLELHELARDHQRFFLWHGLELARVAHALVFLHLVDALLDGLEVGEHAAEPTLVHIRHAALLGVRLNRILSLTLGTDEHDRSAVRSEVPNVGVRVLETVERLIQIEDVDPVALAMDESLHLRIPTPRLMTEVDARVEQLLHRDDCHVESLPAVSMATDPGAGGDRSAGMSDFSTRS